MILCTRIQAGDSLMSMLNSAGRNLGLLKLQRQKLGEDQRDKVTAIGIDNAILKLRRRRYPHRWVMCGN
jgi:hypothetical protein